MIHAPFKELLHPRGPNGRFTESHTGPLDANGRKRAAGFAAKFSPHKVTGPDDAHTYLSGLSGTKPPDPAIGAYLSDPRAVNDTLRAGKADGPGVAALDAAMKPLPDDLLAFRRVPASAFGQVDPKSLVGMQVRDASFFPATLAPPKGDPTDVLLHLAVPSGTKAAPSPDTSGVVLDRGVDMAVTRAVDRPDGGTDLYLVAMPDGAGPGGTGTGAKPIGQPATESTTAPTALDSPAGTGPADVAALIDGGIPSFADSSPEADAQRAQAVAALGSAMNGEYGGFRMEVARVSRYQGGPLAENPGVQATLTIRDAAGAQIGRSQRALYRDDNGDLVAVHELLEIDNPNQRGGGLASAFNAHLTDWYRQQGVTRIELTANIDIGGYAWASHGYDFADQQSADRVITRLRGQADGYESRAAELRRSGDTAGSDAVAEQATQARALLGRAESEPFGSEEFPTPFEISQIGRPPGVRASGDTTWLGRDAMLGSSWEGVRWL